MALQIYNSGGYTIATEEVKRKIGKRSNDLHAKIPNVNVSNHHARALPGQNPEQLI